VVRARTSFDVLARQGQPPGHSFGRVVHAVDGDHGGESRFVRRCPRGEHPAEADPHQRDPVVVDAGEGGEVVEHGADHVLPVRAQRQAAAVDRTGLSRAVEGQRVVPAVKRRQPAQVVQFLGAAVETVVHHHGRTREPVVGRPVEPPLQHGPLVGDPHRFDHGPVQARRRREARGTALVGVVDPGITGITVEEELGGAVVRRRAQHAVAGTDPVSGVQTGLRLGLHAVGGGSPRGVPALVVTGRDLLGRGEHLTDIGSAVGGVPEDPQRLEPELRVIGEHHWSHQAFTSPSGLGRDGTVPS
jgi:hypothetical protein